MYPAPHEVRRVGVIRHHDARQAPQEDADLGTPETRARITRDPILRLFDADKITQEQYDAAVMIAKGWQIITAGMGAQIATYGTRVPSGYGDPSSEYAVLLIRRYRAWAAEVGARERAAWIHTHHGARRSRLPAILDVVVHGHSCAYVEGCRRMRKGALLDHLKDALDVYGAIRREERKVAKAA